MIKLTKPEKYWNFGFISIYVTTKAAEILFFPLMHVSNFVGQRKLQIGKYIISRSFGSIEKRGVYIIHALLLQHDIGLV